VQELRGKKGSPLPRVQPAPLFKGFPEFRSNVLYCPKQFFTLVVPNSSVNCIRLVAYMLRRTLGWVDETGEPLSEQHEFSYRELESAAGVSHSRLKEAIESAIECRFIRQTKSARMQSLGVRSQSASYELCWDDNRYTDRAEEFAGFYLQPSYIDDGNQTRLGRKNIPNVFFDYLVKNESRGLIRVVGTLLWYSIDWSKAGERRQPVKKSLRDLEELTQLDKSSVVRALDEAETKGYVERIERGVFDMTGRNESSVTTYGIRWTTDYTYTYDGLPVEVEVASTRSQNATRPPAPNAPKMQHGEIVRTLPKRNTENSPERSQNATQDAPKTQHGERSQNATLRITKSTIPNTSINNNSSTSPALNAVAAGLVKSLMSFGFKTQVAEQLVRAFPAPTIQRQLALFPQRTATKNPLGLLRKAIEEDWPEPQKDKTTDVGSLPGFEFAAHFYAGYHGNPEAPVSDPSRGDAEAAERFVKRLLKFSSDQTQASIWGRQFGEFVAHAHARKRDKFPALQPALRQHGDDFFNRFRESVQAEKVRKVREAREAHFERFQGAYRAYLAASFEREEKTNSAVYQEYLREEEESLQTLRENRFGLKVPEVIKQFQSAEARLERFSRFVILAENRSVLDFWGWDEKENAKRFDDEAKV
jgi:hypothetical protein